MADEQNKPYVENDTTVLKNTIDNNISISESNASDNNAILTDILLQDINISNILNSYLNTKNARIKLNPKGANVLRNILTNYPVLISNIGNNITNIAADNVIDINDLPTIILLVKDIINSDAKQLKKLKVTRGDIADMIETIIFILIETDTIKTGENKETFISLLKLSMQMLDANLDLDKTLNCSCC